MAGPGLPRQGDAARSSSRWSTARSIPTKPVLVRMHSLDLFADVLGEAGAALGPAPGRDADDRGSEGSGVIVALHAAAPGSLSRSIDLRAGKPAEAGDAVRGYGIGAQILAALGIHDMILLTNTHHSPVALVGLWPRDRRGAADRRWRTELMATILIAEARFYPHLNDMLLAGARAAIEAAGHKHETLTVPGALELPGAIALAARSGRFAPSSRSAW